MGVKTELELGSFLRHVGQVEIQIEGFAVETSPGAPETTTVSGSTTVGHMIKAL